MTAPALEGVDLSIAPGGTTLLTGWSFRAAGGEMIALRGPSGSGKTTLLYALAGLTAASGGKVLAAGAAGAAGALWRDASTGVVLQNLCLAPVLTAWETVALPLQVLGRSRQETSVGAGRALDSLGLSSHAGQLVGDLSGGQRQRVAVARALAGEHDYILADEPTSALDPHWRRVVLELLAEQARRGALVIVATSDATVAEACHRVVVVGS